MSSSDAAIDRQPAVGARGDDAQNVVRSGVGCSIAASRSRGTISCSRVAQAETERAVEPHLLLRLEQPAVAALRDQQRDLLGRVDVAVAGWRHAQQPSSSTPLPFSSAIDQAKSRIDHCIGSDGEERRPRRMLQGE